MLSFLDEMSSYSCPYRLLGIGVGTQPRTEATARESRRRQLGSLQAKAVAVPTEHDAYAQKA